MDNVQKEDAEYTEERTLTDGATRQWETRKTKEEGYACDEGGHAEDESERKIQKIRESGNGWFIVTAHKGKSRKKNEGRRA